MPTPRPALLIKLSHTGFYADGRTNPTFVYVPDLDVGYEYQTRKVPAYVPPGGFITINASSRSMLSYEQGGIRKLTEAGLIESQMFYVPESYPTTELPSASEYPAGTFVWNTDESTAYWSDGSSWTIGKAIPAGPAGGDLSGTYPNPVVVGLQQYPLTDIIPEKGNSLLFDGINWTPATLAIGGGAVGHIYYFDITTPVDPPVPSGPGFPSEEFSLLTIASAAPESASFTLSTVMSPVAAFSTQVGEPVVSSIPAGLWTFCIWAKSSSPSESDTNFRLRIFAYDTSGPPTLIATSADVLMYLPSDIHQYTVNVAITQTPITPTTRIHVVIDAKSSSGATLELHFGDATPTFVQTTVSTVSGTGIPHIIDGITQGFASPIVDGDVASANKDGLASVYSMRTLGTGSQQACAGDDSRLSDSRNPTGTAGGDLSGTYPNPTVDGLQGRGVSPSAPFTDDVLMWSGSEWTPSIITGSVGWTVSGSFSDSTNQSIPTNPSTLAVSFNTLEVAGGVTVANNLSGKPTRLTVPRDGLYQFDISPQMVHTGGTGTVIYFWVSINGTPVPRTTSSFEMGNNNNRSIPFITILTPMLSGQYVEWFFTQSGASTALTAFTPGGVIPNIPSAIANVIRIGNIPV